LRFKTSASATLIEYGGVFADVFIVYLVRMLWRLATLLRSRRWTKVNATVLGCHLNKSAYNSVSVDYEYEVDGQKRAETFLKPFIWDSSAKVYADQFGRGTAFKIRIKPADSDVSVADTSVEHWWTF
jgi:hypothetical protein